MKYLKRGLLMCILFGSVIFIPSDLPSCGPFFPTAVFTEKKIPPLPEYFHGHLGVLQPTYRHKYLFVAFRYLSGQPLTEEEKQSLLNPSKLPSEPESIWTGTFSATPAMKEWVDARNGIPGIKPLQELNSFRNDAGRSTSGWRFFRNCSEDAFKTAAHTLDERIKSFGVDHPGIKSWADAQDLVFSNCHAGEVIPSASDPQLPQTFKYDRAYQIAAAHFYAEHFDTAAAMFNAIEIDRGSPWSEIAPYLVARCWIRKATVTQKYGEFNRNALMEADRKLKAILNDKSRVALHSAAAKLESFVDLRLNPLDRFRSLEKKLEQPNNGTAFEQDLIDYLNLIDCVDTLYGLSLADASRGSEMSDWILKFSSSDAAYCIERWKATKRASWLLAAIIKSRAGDPDAAALMVAAQNIPKDSPAFATAQYHRVRLMIESGKSEEGRRLLDELLPAFRSRMQNSSLNLFLAQRLELARNFDEFLEFAPRTPQEIENNYNPQELAEYTGSGVPLFDSDSIKTLNRALPLKYMSRAATSNLPLNLRKQILRASWVRAVLISDNVTAAKLSGEMENAFPELKPDLKLWRGATDAESKRFAAALLMLHFPGTSPYLHSGVPPRGKIDGIDHYRENWWCGFNDGDPDAPTRFRHFGFEGEKKTSEQVGFPSFLSDSDKAEFMSEWQKMAVVPTAPDYFGKIVIPWAKKHPSDSRAPEALYLVVKATRFGCTDSDSGTYSREAFQLLHSKYPDTGWAKTTPYWYR
jgi:hypothetical protein